MKTGLNWTLTLDQIQGASDAGGDTGCSTVLQSFSAFYTMGNQRVPGYAFFLLTKFNG